MLARMAFADDLSAFASAHGLEVVGLPRPHEFRLQGNATSRRVTMRQGPLLQPRGGQLAHFRLSFEPFTSAPMWLVTPQSTTRWDPEPTQTSRAEVPGFSRFDAPLAAFDAAVKTHWQLKLGEQERLDLEALELVRPSAWELAWQVLEAVWPPVTAP